MALRSEARQVAEEAARAVGGLIRDGIGQAARVETKASAADLVTEVDRACEEVIRRHIQAAFPAHAFLGEEMVAPGPDAAIAAAAQVEREPHVWVVDPLDGTTNFVHGLPEVSVSIALFEQGRVTVGVVYDPLRDQLYSASLGEGAFLVGGGRLAVSATASLADSLVATGFPADPRRWRPRLARAAAPLVLATRNVRNLGSAALHLAYVAAGRLDAFYELSLNPWDLAAGCLLVQEAGGQATDTRGGPYTLATRHVLATNGRIHQAFLAFLAEIGATGFEPD